MSSTPRSSNDQLNNQSHRHQPHNPSALFPRDNVVPRFVPGLNLTAEQQELCHQVAVNDYRSFVSYVCKHPAVFNYNEQGFLSQIATLLRRGDRALVESCAEKFVLLRECKNNNVPTSDKYLRVLADQHRDHVAYIERQSTNLIDYCTQNRDNLITRSVSISAQQPTGQVREGEPTSRPAGSRGVPEINVARIARHGNPSTSAPSPQYQVQSQPPQRHTPSMNDSRRLERQRSNTEAIVPADRRQLETIDEQGDASMRQWVEERESFAERSGLRDGYKLRLGSEAGRFFRVGRVFAIFLHHERADTARVADHQSQGQFVTRIPRLGINIISHKQRYVVVKQGHGFCWAIPIHTYSGHGMFKPGLNAELIRNHAIIYTDHPVRLRRRVGQREEAEPEMSKNPIKVDPVNASAERKLENASRLDFAKPATIEHNVKAFDIGMIAESSMAHFRRYWSQHSQDPPTSGGPDGSHGWRSQDSQSLPASGGGTGGAQGRHSRHNDPVPPTGGGPDGGHGWQRTPRDKRPHT